jgi:hypothetical protein
MAAMQSATPFRKDKNNSSIFTTNDVSRFGELIISVKLIII